MEPLRVNVINELKLLADRKSQDDYHRNVPIADTVAELISGWFDDSFLVDRDDFEENFSKEEWKVLCEFTSFYRSRLHLLPENYEELVKTKAWLEIVELASCSLDKLTWRELDAKYDEFE